MKKKHLLALISLSLLAILTLLTLPLTAAQADDARVDFSNVILNVGATQTERNIVWHSDLHAAGEVHYAKAPTEAGTFPETYLSAKATVAATADAGTYSYKATVTALEEHTDYVYRLKVGDALSSVYTFSTRSFSDDYSFIFLSDAQIMKDTHGNSWQDTLKKIGTHFPDASFIVSAGDQTNDPSSESEFDLFAKKELSSLAIATTCAPPHDNSRRYTDHFHLPNLSTCYGVTATTSDYYYTYNSTLFVHLNVENATASEHAEFLSRAIQSNPSAVWQVVVLHYSFYSGGDHSEDSVVKNLRAALVPKFNELGVDVVLSGHDHIYARSELMTGSTAVSEDTVTDRTVLNPEGTLYLCASSPTGSKLYDAINQDYIAYQTDTKRKSIVHFEMSEEEMTFTAYYVDKDVPEAFDSFTIRHTKEPVRLDPETEMLCLSVDGQDTRIPLINAYAYRSATVKVEGGEWVLSEDGVSFTSLGIAATDDVSCTVLRINEDTGLWELSLDAGESFSSLSVQTRRTRITFASDPSLTLEDDLSRERVRTYTELPPDVPAISLPIGSPEEGALYTWHWEYRTATGETVDSLSLGEDYYAFPVATQMPLSDIIPVSEGGNAAAGVYTWTAAWRIAEQFPETAFTLTLTEDLTLSSEDAVVLYSTANVTVDLCGHTLDSSLLKRMIDLHPFSTGSRCGFVTSVEGGKLLSQAVFRANAGVGARLSLFFGNEGGIPLTVEALGDYGYLVDGGTSFKSGATLTLDVFDGNYSLTKGIVCVSNSSSSAGKNIYSITLKNANMTLWRCAIDFEDGIFAGLDSKITAYDSVFSAYSTRREITFFQSDSWGGRAFFYGTAFNSVAFPSDSCALASRVRFGEGCSFSLESATLTEDGGAFSASNAGCTDACVLQVKGDRVEVVIPSKEESTDTPTPPPAEDTTAPQPLPEETETTTASTPDAEAEVPSTEEDTVTTEPSDTTGAEEDSTSSPAASTTPNAPPPSTVGDEDEIPAGLIIVTLILTVAVGGVVVTVALGRISKGKK